MCMWLEEEAECICLIRCVYVGDLVQSTIKAALMYNLGILPHLGQ
jgi:hypothetical protein